jgi:hypothetical protein
LQLCSVRALKIYFAGPLFTPYERSFIDECAAALRADGFEVFRRRPTRLAMRGRRSRRACSATPRSLRGREKTKRPGESSPQAMTGRTAERSATATADD